jgi:hypothetical protein
MKNDRATTTNGTAANSGFERELWKAADALGSNMDAAEYKHVVLGENCWRDILGRPIFDMSDWRGHPPGGKRIWEGG